MQIHIYASSKLARIHAISEWDAAGTIVVSGDLLGALRTTGINPTADEVAAIQLALPGDGYLHLITLDVPEDHALAAVTVARDTYFHTVEEAIEDVAEECYFPVIEQIAGSRQFVYEGPNRAREWLAENPRRVMSLSCGQGCYF